MTIQNIADRELPQSITKLLEREGTGISWADLTMNFWIGCQEVSPACDLCYARDFTNMRVNAARVAAGKPPIEWGPGGARYQTTEANRKKPIRWNGIAEAAGARLRVFCSSLSDWADNAVPDEWRAEIAERIVATPWLDWMLLTKRIGNAEKMLRAMFPDGVPSNVWLGITVCNQEEADRDVPRALFVKRELGISKIFLSCEPMLGAIDLRQIMLRRDGQVPTDLSSRLGDYVRPLSGNFRDSPRIDIVICGGESGPHARPMHPDWARALRDQCAATGVAFHFKQWGEWAPLDYFRSEKGIKEKPIKRIPDRKIDADDTGDGVVWYTDVVRVGVRKAGHLLDGKEHREIPA